MEANINGIFPTPIYISKVDRKLTPLELKFVDKNKKDFYKNEGNITTNNNYILNEKPFANIKKELDLKVQDYFDKVISPANKIKPYITQSWLNLLGLNTNFTVFINHSLALSNTGLEHEYGYVYLARYVPADNLKNDDRKRESIAKEQAKLDLAKIFSANNLDTPEVLGIEYNSSHVAQPIFAPENISHEKNKREILLSRNVFLSDMWATFPHDRGQNYACLNATNAAEFINDMLNLVER